MFKRFIPILTLTLFLTGVFLSACQPAAAIPLTGNLTVSTLSGGERGFKDGNGNEAQLDTPNGLALGSDGSLYVADWGNARIRKISVDGVTSTFAGSGEAGNTDGSSTEMQMQSPDSLAINGGGEIAFTGGGMMDGSSIRILAPDGSARTLAGSTASGSKDGQGKNASFRAPLAIAYDKDGNLYAADSRNNRIRRVTPDGTVTTFAGPVDAGLQAGYVDGAAAEARFNNPSGITVDSTGNVYVADTGNNCIRKITPDGQVSTFAGSKTPGFLDADGPSALFNLPSGLAVDTAGSVYVADTANHSIRKITPDGVVTTVAGTGKAGYVDGPASQAQFVLPTALVVDSNGTIYVSDTGNNLIRKISSQ